MNKTESVDCVVMLVIY